MPESIVYNEDCMVGMARYPDKYFELSLVDPPYGIGCNEMTRGLGGKKIKKSKISWDNNIPSENYFNELKRISINYIVWGGNYYPYIWPCKCYIVWDKREWNIPYRNMADSELAATNFNKSARTFRYVWDGFNKGSQDKHTIKEHPAQKPIQLYKWLLKNYAKPGDKILDTHGGSMSSVIACLEMGFSIHCYELDKDYYNQAKQRINVYLQQGNLFQEKQNVTFIDSH